MKLAPGPIMVCGGPQIGVKVRTDFTLHQGRAGRTRAAAFFAGRGLERMDD